MFKRLQHQRIAHVLASLDGAVLTRHNCLFGGGTCIALRCGEYRESLDIDFLVSDPDGYRQLRQVLTGPLGLNALLRSGAQQLVCLREMRADQYGLRTHVQMDSMAIKLEIVREARISLESPTSADMICGISTLTSIDLATSKLLANSDRFADDGTFNRDVIDLAMLALSLPLLRKAVAKAEQAYGIAVLRDLARSVDRIQQRPGWLERCMQVMAMTLPKAVMWKKISALRRVLPKS